MTFCFECIDKNRNNGRLRTLYYSEDCQDCKKRLSERETKDWIRFKPKEGDGIE